MAVASAGSRLRRPSRVAFGGWWRRLPRMRSVTRWCWRPRPRWT